MPNLVQLHWKRWPWSGNRGQTDEHSLLYVIIKLKQKDALSGVHVHTVQQEYEWMSGTEFCSMLQLWTMHSGGGDRQRPGSRQCGRRWGHAVSASRPAGRWYGDCADSRQSSRQSASPADDEQTLPPPHRNTTQQCYFITTVITTNQGQIHKLLLARRQYVRAYWAEYIICSEPYYTLLAWTLLPTKNPGS